MPEKGLKVYANLTVRLKSASLSQYIINIEVLIFNFIKKSYKVDTQKFHNISVKYITLDGFNRAKNFTLFTIHRERQTPTSVSS